MHEALECHGGNGFIEEGPMARLYREAPLNGIWEGSGNIIALDVLRAAARSPQSVPAFLDEVRRSRRAPTAASTGWSTGSRRSCSTATSTRRGARRIVEKMAIVLQASLLVRHSPQSVADAFCATRLDGDGGRGLWQPAAGLDQKGIVERARGDRRCVTSKARWCWSPAAPRESDARRPWLRADAAPRS